MKMNPYLSFDGSCEEAFKTYAKVLGGEIVAMLPYKDMPMENNFPPEWGKKIAHARLIFGDNVLMASDASPERYKPMEGVSVTLNIPEPAEAERVFDALADDGKVDMALDETFWAHKFGVLVDRFGTRWMVNCEKPR
ncbi:MAG: VOC family protein [Methyloceanibacter sp.]|uniref:VOC family protein n=1 Tax=Methyloceanibacter sp. TaxID=1965321 RepID=UPI003D6CA55F